MHPRIYVDQELSLGDILSLPPPSAHHIGTVLRLTVGAGLTVLNGLGGEYEAIVTQSFKGEVKIQIQDYRLRSSESPYPISIAQSLATGDKMDWVVEKSVELGASDFYPLMAQRSILKLDQTRAAKKHKHWSAIVEAASKQCGRNRLMRIHPVASLSAWLSTQATIHGADKENPENSLPPLRLLLSPTHSVSFSTLPQVPAGTPITLLVGPEAGLTDAEEDQASKIGYQAIRLGPRVLRTETAGLAALAAIAARWGDF